MKYNLLAFFITCWVITLQHKKYTCAFSQLYSHSNHYLSRPQPINEQLKSLGSKRNLLTIARQPMRISLHTDDLDTVKASQNGETQTTSARLNFLKKSIQVTQSFFEARLSLIPQATVSIPSTCFDYDPPQTDVDNGINTDLRVYVRYLTDSTKGYGATGVSCAWNADSVTFPDTSLKSHRPTVGRMIYNTYTIIDQQSSLTNRLFASITATSIHQFIHILGFDQSLYEFYMDINTGNKHGTITVAQQLNNRRSGGDNHMMFTPQVKAWAMEHFDCNTLTGMAVQNEQGSGNAVGSHWQRLSVYDELMTGTQMGTQKAFTALTFALLIDMGWYGVDGSFNDTTNYGKNLGCEFFTDACYSTTIQYPKYFCNAANYNNVTQCSTTFLGKAGCMQDSALMADGCGMFLDYWSCVDPDTPEYGYEKWSLEQYATDSFCVSGTAATLGISTDYRGRCYKYVCDLDEKKITFTVGQYTYTCFQQDAGLQKTVSSLNGYIQCPNYQDFCVDSRKICPNWCSQHGFCTGGICNCEITDTIAYSGEDCSITICTDSQYYNPDSGVCQSVCPDGTYGNKFSRTCMPCSSDCLKCRDEPHICTGCTTSGGVQLYFVNHTSLCVTQCPQGTFRNGQYCQLCDASANCLTCQGSATLCKSCVNNDPSNLLFLSNPSGGTCASTCTESFYTLKDMVEYVCRNQCPPHLDLQGDQCRSCNPDYMDVDGTGNCETDCPAEYYKNDEKYSCEPCHSSCKQCSGGYAQNCTACKQTGTVLKFLHLDMCLQKCYAGYYQDQAQGACIICPAQLNCKTCYFNSGDSQIYCVTCKYDYFLHADETCSQGCDSGMYKNTWNQSCDDCHNDCKQCTSSSSSSCLSCDSPKYLIKNQSGSFCVDQCPTQGYVTFAATTCASCHQTCKSCIGLNSDDCTQCTDGLYLQDRYCRYVCSPGKYPDSSTSECQSCDSKCSFCYGNTQDNCTKCKSPYVLDNSTCVKQCPEGQSANSYNICQMQLSEANSFELDNKMFLFVLIGIMLVTLL